MSCATWCNNLSSLRWGAESQISIIYVRVMERSDVFDTVSVKTVLFLKQSHTSDFHLNGKTFLTILSSISPKKMLLVSLSTR